MCVGKLHFLCVSFQYYKVSVSKHLLQKGGQSLICLRIMSSEIIPMWFVLITSIPLTKMSRVLFRVERRRLLILSKPYVSVRQ